MSIWDPAEAPEPLDSAISSPRPVNSFLRYCAPDRGETETLADLAADRVTGAADYLYGGDDRVAP